MIQARFGLSRLPFDKSIATDDLYQWPALDELLARLEMAKSSRGIMLLTGEESIREVISFPKTTSSLCLLTGSPSEVSEKQLDELKIKFSYAS